MAVPRPLEEVHEMGSVNLELDEDREWTAHSLELG